MKILPRLLFLVLACLAAAGAGAEGSKVGFVDMARVDQEAPQIELVRGKLQNEFADRERELLDQQEALRELEGQLIREGSGMEDGERRKLEREVQSGQREWKRKQEEFREDYIIRKNEEMEDLSKTITDTIRDFARAEKFDLILVSGAVYASDASDVTGRILEWLGRQQQQQNNNDRKHQP